MWRPRLGSLYGLDLKPLTGALFWALFGGVSGPSFRRVLSFGPFPRRAPSFGPSSSQRAQGFFLGPSLKRAPYLGPSSWEASLSLFGEAPAPSETSTAVAHSRPLTPQARVAGLAAGRRGGRHPPPSGALWHARRRAALALPGGCALRSAGGRAAAGAGAAAAALRCAAPRCATPCRVI